MVSSALNQSESKFMLEEIVKELKPQISDQFKELVKSSLANELVGDSQFLASVVNELKSNIDVDEAVATVVTEISNEVEKELTSNLQKKLRINIRNLVDDVDVEGLMRDELEGRIDNAELNMIAEDILNEELVLFDKQGEMKKALKHVLVTFVKRELGL